MESLWSLYGVFTESLLSLYGVFMESIWSLYGVNVKSIWCLYEYDTMPTGCPTMNSAAGRRHPVYAKLKGCDDDK
jgi:hypothetical protein